MPLFRKKQSQAGNVPPHPRDIGESNWAVAEGEMDGAPVIVRLNTSIAAAVVIPSTPSRLVSQFLSVTRAWAVSQRAKRASN